MDTNPSGLRIPGMIALLVVGLALGLFAAQFLPADFLGVRDHSHDSRAEEKEVAGGQLWTCGMHPHVIEEEPGTCPICGMNLTPMNAPTMTDAGRVENEESQWACPDHPSFIEAGPGTCPIDGQELVLVAGPSADPEADGTGRGAIVEIDPAVVQNMNVRTESVIRTDLTRPIRTVGYLDFDQQRMVTVTTKYAGWVEQVHVNYVGEKVKRGQTLFEIYSPELVQTEEELLSALEFAKAMADAPQDAKERAWSMVESARARLSYWDIKTQQIERLEETGEVFRTLEVSAPASGLVMKRMPGLEGMAVQPGMQLFHIADLSSLWLSVELFEDQLASVREGTEAQISLSYFPGESFAGQVRFLEPELSEKTRTVRAMIEIPNRDGRLRKGMYATVELQPLEVEDALVVPIQSVLRTGQRDVVVVALGGGRFEPRDVVLGHESAGLAQVLEGLSDGERVVTSAQFLLDSESTLREAIQKMVADRQGGAPSPGRGEAGDESHAPHHGH